MYYNFNTFIYITQCHSIKFVAIYNSTNSMLNYLIPPNFINIVWYHYYTLYHMIIKVIILLSLFFHSFINGPDLSKNFLLYSFSLSEEPILMDWKINLFLIVLKLVLTIYFKNLSYTCKNTSFQFKNFCF